jgi:tRNA nucleotidyltransferase (CCA-adding enzyme)
LIDELRLYDTIFTDPTSNTGFSPEHALWRPSYTCLFDILSGVYPSVIKKMLLPDHDHEYTAWMLANFTAWIDAPTPQPAKPGGKMPPHIAVNAAREGIKAPNKISDVLNLAIRDTNEILSLKNGFASSQRTGASTATADCATRDTLGMAIRRWGSTWRSQAVFTLMLEVARSTKDPHGR